ncbi:class I adenylate-forming enzyme family protein [uncultured Paraglaciecola sp.]|uniref:AMP-binding protein n=1 Tax=uncultured Paraglaciecola sp. TaxID=1765024 RepID=UPI00259A0B31|nr:class I adenylate-forming enzyme family protein [uncultured Paraglaciecola sp.]
MSTFESVLHSLNKQSQIITDADRVTAEQLLAEALALRTAFAKLKAKSVAVIYTDSISFVTALIAFDGFCEKIYLCSKDSGKDTPQDVYRWSVKSTSDFTEVTQGGELSQPLQTKWYLASSGTSGKPKWFSHSFTNLISQIRVSDTLKNLCWANLYEPHRFAGLQVLLQALLSGASLVVTAQTSLIDKVKIFAQQGVSAISATPSMWRQLLMTNQLQSLSLSNITLGGEIADQGILDSLSYIFPKANIRHIYASTEAGIGFVVSDKGAGFPKSWLQEGVNNAELTVDDNQHLRIKPKGELDKSLDSLIDNNGFLDTQDRVDLINDRVLFLGRASGIINVGGNKVHPEKVESVLLSVNGVQQSRVYAKANSVLGALVEADIVIGKSFDRSSVLKNIREECKLQLQRFEIPVKLTQVANIRVNSSGKLSRSNVND